MFRYILRLQLYLILPEVFKDIAFMQIKNLILLLFIFSINTLAAEAIGTKNVEKKSYVGVPSSGYAKVSKELLLSISEELLSEDIAEVDIDPGVFDLHPEEEKTRNRSKKLDDLDEIEFAHQSK